MRIKIAGHSGYLGNIISEYLAERGHVVSGIKRNLLYNQPELLKEEIKGAEVIINLAGAPILCRWNKKNKNLIYESRVLTTKNLVAAIQMLAVSEQPKKLVQASAIGIYSCNRKHNETSTDFDSGFLGHVVKDWENASLDVPTNVQRIVFRIGLVIGRRAKTITNQLLPFKLGLGATIGNGKQPFPFIHEKDVVRAFGLVVENDVKTNVFNLVAPEQITGKDFTKALAKKLHRPSFLSVPAFLVKLALGEAAVLLIQSPEVEPKNLPEQGFYFSYPDVNSALAEILKSER